jgi:hypothetical protein
LPKAPTLVELQVDASQTYVPNAPPRLVHVVTPLEQVTLMPLTVSIVVVHFVPASEQLIVLVSAPPVLDVLHVEPLAQLTVTE